MNDKVFTLTEEQIEALKKGEEIRLTGLTIKLASSCFAMKPGNTYYYIDHNGIVCNFEDTGSKSDAKTHGVANYCTDEQLMKQRALHETLNRLLWRFSCENGELENAWDGRNKHFCILLECEKNEFQIIECQYAREMKPYFSSKELAQEALDKIIKPFMAKHPDFVW